MLHLRIILAANFVLGRTFCFFFTSAVSNIQDKSHSLFPFFVSKSKFSNHNTVYSHAEGIIYMYIYNPSTFINVIIIFSEVHFESISSHSKGSCLYAVSDVFAHNIFRNGSARLIMKDITAVKNSQFSGFNNINSAGMHSSPETSTRKG